MEAVVLVTTAIWHALAVWHFTFFPARTLARATSERPVNVIATELFRFLGGMNLSLVVLPLAALALETPHRWPVYLALAIGNATQGAQDLRVQRLGLARGAFFKQIFAGDVVFTTLNIAMLIVSLRA